MKRYIKDGVIKTRKQITIRVGNRITYNPSEDKILADGWVEYVPVVVEPTEEEKFEQAKEELRSRINEHNESSDVDQFYIQGMPVWLDKATRVGLQLRFDAEEASGRTNTTLWYEGIPFPLEIALAKEMLKAIELYASECYDNTQRHLAEVDKLTTIDEVKGYNYREGYPEKLSF